MHRTPFSVLNKMLLKVCFKLFSVFKFALQIGYEFLCYGQSFAYIKRWETNGTLTKIFSWDFAKPLKAHMPKLKNIYWGSTFHSCKSNWPKTCLKASGKKGRLFLDVTHLLGQICFGIKTFHVYEGFHL